MSAATAVNILNANALSLGYWEQFRDKTVAVAGIVLFMGLLSILTEAVIIAMRFCTTGVFSVSMVSVFLSFVSLESGHVSFGTKVSASIEMVTYHIYTLDSTS